MSSIDVDAVIERALRAIAAANNDRELEAVRLDYLGRTRGALSDLIALIPSLPPEERRNAGQAVNRAKTAVAAALDERQRSLDSDRLSRLAIDEAFDVTFPPPALSVGHLHVLNRIRREIVAVMAAIGYHVEEGPEIETDWYNFEALNLGPGHPSRDMQETLFMDDGGENQVVLRTHTSPVQIRAMQKLQPPIRVIAPGRVYRRENLDATHLANFMQCEGLAVDVGLTVGDLKGTLLYFIRSVLGEHREVRMRPDHFPYTEPSYEFDISCGICGGRGCRSCGGDGWLEVGGCGMVHPNVIRNGGHDPDRVRGFAWGFGIERMAMLKYGIDDLRAFYENDVDFLAQF